jgi:hypothetical protein
MMARRSSGVVDAGASGYPPGGFSAADPWDPPVQKGRRGRGERRGWGGSGGRWWIYVGRAILWAFIIVVLVNGVRAPFERFMAKPAPAGRSGSGEPRFPSAAASSYALAFANVYLHYDRATALDRQRQLSQFLAPDVDPQLGWDGGGRSVLQSAQVSSVDPDDASHAIVTVLVRANDRSFQLAVPVYAKDGAMAISGRPAILAPPPKASVPVLTQDRDSALESGLAEPLAGFFKAYASSDVAALQRYSDPPVTGLGGAVTFGQVKEIIAPKGAPDSRTVNATVVWQVPPAQPKISGSMLEQTYRLTMVKKDGNWYVTSIRGSTLPAES